MPWRPILFVWHLIWEDLGSSALYEVSIAFHHAISPVVFSPVAMVAGRFNIPVIFCAETYKLSDKVQLDSIHWNEIGDPQELVRSERNVEGGPAVLEKHKEIPSLKLLNIRYDLTPIKYVSMVLTEGGASLHQACCIEPHSTNPPHLVRNSACSHPYWRGHRI